MGPRRCGAYPFLEYSTKPRGWSVELEYLSDPVGEAKGKTRKIFSSSVFPIASHGLTVPTHGFTLAQSVVVPIC